MTTEDGVIVFFRLTTVISPTYHCLNLDIFRFFKCIAGSSRVVSIADSSCVVSIADSSLGVSIADSSLEV